MMDLLELLKGAGMSKPYVIITGASSGIGKAMAEVFSENGHNTILIARRQDQLEDIAQNLSNRHDVDSIPMVCNLQSNDDINKCMDEIKTLGLTVEGVINNAGMSNFGRFDETDITDDLDMTRLNIVAVTYFTKKVIPMLEQQGGGIILNVASAVGYYPLPYQAVYAATKAFIISFRQALHSELVEKNIIVSTLCPGNVKTEFIEKSGLNVIQSKVGSNNKLAAGIDPKLLAQKTYNQLMQGKRVIYSEKSVERLVRSVKFFSQDKLTDNQYRKRKIILER